MGARLLIRAARPLAALTLLVMVLTGCQDPYQRDQRHHRHAAAASAATPTTEASRADRPGRAPGPLPAAALRPAATADAAASSFARAWENWDWRTAAAQQRALARLAVGQLARDLRSSAQSATADASLSRDKPSSRGTGVAIDLKPNGAHASGVVVTLDQTYTGGHADLGGQHYRVYLVQLVRAGRGWGVSSWAPQQ
jgi:hypothetical protein